VLATALLAMTAPALPADCRAELGRLAAEARSQGYEAVEGPYEVEAGDWRAHTVVAGGGGHRIVEHRCVDGRVVTRSWSEHPDGAGDADAATPIESLLRGAVWLEQDGREQ
jgi:hypothetical protein